MIMHTQHSGNMAKKWIFVSMLFMLFMLVVGLVLLSRNSGTKKSIEPNRVKVISDDVIKGIKSYKNNILGISFDYPADLGEFSFKEEKGFVGSGFYINAKNGNRSLSISGFSEDYASDDILPINIKDYKTLDTKQRLEKSNKTEILLPVLDDYNTSQIKGIFRLSFGEMQAVNAVSVRVQYLTSLNNQKYKSAVFEFQGFTDLELEQFAHSIKIN